jgi:hypothetical protein
LGEEEHTAFAAEAAVPLVEKEKTAFAAEVEPGINNDLGSDSPAVQCVEVLDLRQEPYWVVNLEPRLTTE